MQADEARELAQRITDYLSSGGLFNPEMAVHDSVKALLIDCRSLAERASKGAGGSEK